MLVLAPYIYQLHVRETCEVSFDERKIYKLLEKSPSFIMKSKFCEKNLEEKI